MDEVGRMKAAARGLDFPSIVDAPALFVARARKMRPQGAYYHSFHGSLVPLFDACGPERDPKDAGADRRHRE